MRYEKIVQCEKIGQEGHCLVRATVVAIVGVGALGSVAAEMLVRSGVKKVILIDRDVVELSNLQRQSLYDETDVQKMKVLAAQEKLRKMNADVAIVAHAADLDVENVHLLDGVDLIVDGTDNFYTRFLINDFCRQRRIPWVFAAVVGSKGMVFPVLPEGPCLRCIFAEPTGVLGTCDTEGVLAAAVHAIAAIQGTEALKILTKAKAREELVTFDVWNLVINTLHVTQRDGCPACAGNFEFLAGKKKEDAMKVCGASAFQFKKTLDLPQVTKRLRVLGEVIETEHCAFFRDLVLFRDGRVLVKASSVENAKGVYAKYLG